MKYVCYYRVSTEKQGQSGLGLESQQYQVAQYIKNKTNAVVVDEFVEVESGKKTNREQLQQAIKLAKKHNAILLVAKLDRLARNVRYFLELLDQLPIEFVDLPNLGTGTSDSRLMLTQFAAFAEWERNKISERTKAALAAKRARGETISEISLKNITAGNEAKVTQANEFAKQIAPVLLRLNETMTQRQMVEYLNTTGIKSPMGGQWGLSGLNNVLKRCKALQQA